MINDFNPVVAGKKPIGPLLGVSTMFKIDGWKTIGE